MTRLATTSSGHTQIVTTNFDRLFDDCGTSQSSFVAPNLPDLNNSENLDGPVYLHGKLNKELSGAENEQLVLSSSEFGDAYLSNGWATTFIKNIFEKYIVVFVGYSADDPPVQYLLEAMTKFSRKSNAVYAFQDGSLQSAEAIWRHKGVEPIVFNPSNNFQSLWTSLKLWSDQASSPDSWEHSLIKLAQNDPREISQFKRGQIAHILSSAKGANLFARAEPPPPAEWLNVFSPSCRFYSPPAGFDEETKESCQNSCHPYFIDSDNELINHEASNTVSSHVPPEEAWNAFEVRKTDIFGSNMLWSNFFANSEDLPLPNRLREIGWWLSKVAQEPEALTWATESEPFHPQIRKMITQELKTSEKPSKEVFLKAWSYIFESWDEKFSRKKFELLEIERDSKESEWTGQFVRRIERYIKPSVDAKVPYRFLSNKAESDSLNLKELIRLEVKYPEVFSQIEVPQDYLGKIVTLLRLSLEKATDLENEAGKVSLEMNLRASFYPDDSRGVNHFRGEGIFGWISFYIKLLKQLCSYNPEQAKDEMLAWPIDEIIFAKLRIWALGYKALVKKGDVLKQVRLIPRDIFWMRKWSKDTMLSIRSRWPELSPTSKEGVERLIRQGPETESFESRKEFLNRKKRMVLERLSWLKSAGCDLSIASKEMIKKYSAVVEDWEPEQADFAIQSFEPRSGIVTQNTDPSSILLLERAKVLQTAFDISGRNLHEFENIVPFEGLCEKKPIKAISAIRLNRSSKKVKEWGWSAFLSSESAKQGKARLIMLTAKRLFETKDSFSELINPISSWYSEISVKLDKSYPQVHQQLLELIIIALEKSNSDEVMASSRREWTMSALNSPSGRAAKGLMQAIQKDDYSYGEGLPTRWKSYLEKFLHLPPPHYQQAIVMFSHMTNFLFAVDEAWTSRNLFSILEHSKENAREAFWSGLFWRGEIKGQQLFDQLKPHIIKLASNKESSKGFIESIAGILIDGWLLRNQESNAQWISDSELRQLLVKTSDDLRCRILWQTACGKPQKDGVGLEYFNRLISDVWPRQLEARSAKVTSYLCDIAFMNKKEFNKVVNSIISVVTHVDSISPPSLWHKEIFDSHPEAVLILFSKVISDKAQALPYGVGEFISSVKSKPLKLSEKPEFLKLEARWAEYKFK